MLHSLSKVVREPSVILNRLYYYMTGVRIKQMRIDNADHAGTISALQSISSEIKKPIPRLELSQAIGDLTHDEDCRALGDLFEHYGSDKSTKHNYYLLYGSILKNKRGQQVNLLEIGLGTNNTEFVSNMGKDGKPGASLRAFRDWGSHFNVYGADIDKDVLFSEERIKTFFVDQTDRGSLDKFTAQLPAEGFDLIIDDGLHTPWANLNTLLFAIEILKDDGVFVVEDILEKYLPVWEITALILEPKYQCQLIKTKAEFVFVITKRR